MGRSASAVALRTGAGPCPHETPATPGKATMQVHPDSPSHPRHSSLSSLHALNDYGQKRFSPQGRIRETEAPLTTIDEVLSEQTASRVLVKIDTQGHDLAVLAGSAGSFARIVAFQTEVPTRPSYEGEANAADHLKAFMEAGYVIAGFSKPIHDANRLVASNVDCLLVREGLAQAHG